MRKILREIVSDAGGSAAESYAPGAATWAPLLCGLHCVLVPAAALIAPGLMMPEAVEQGLMLFAVVVTAALVSGGLRAHGQWRVLAPIALGLACWALALAAHDDAAAAGGLPEWAVGGAGGVLLFAGLRWNGRLRHAAEHRCGCAYCDEGVEARAESDTRSP